MNHRKSFKASCFLLIVAYALCFSALPAIAAENGVYLATASAHYAHPVTGQVDDPGNNPALGQSMSESVAGGQSLIEVDANGKVFATVRIKMMDSIKTASFKTQGTEAEAFASVSAAIMQENLAANSADYRFAIPSENAIVRIALYITPMGRDVIFFLRFSGLQSGSGDFLSSISVNSASEASSSPAGTAQNASPGSETQEQPQTAVEPANTQDASKDVDALFTAATGLIGPETKSDKKLTDGGSVLYWILGGILLSVILVIGAWYLKTKWVRR